MLALQARVSETLAQLARTDAEIVKLKGQVSALSGRVIALESGPAETPEPSPAGLPVDPDMPSEADRIAMRERLRAGTAAGIEANKKDRNRAGRTYRRAAKDVS